MRLLLVLLIVTIVSASMAPPITSNDKKWVKSSIENNDCHKDCKRADGHVCAGLHKSQCCQRHWCLQDEKLHDVWSCRTGFEIHVDSCNSFPKRDAGFLQETD
ncbi:unnamed protein product (macronuclear) [Paramecium tetraurelia]|uniref:Uncharacterized protein n=1 Tax=Paramecium tetraurelia TaxID=5888 RepID=A0DSJ8_PARTE|nr:uncharacterized protein GSPATT00019719001 [Paramecium tetraurelia]CAK86015.1 unnamed protein product [Paramecium tetraurelia]|eukprot:XP_001453412.1 hypothetical protein (macronuclear) [Paramecium tetraurelia strain d4-2]